jgi:PH domain
VVAESRFTDRRFFLQDVTKKEKGVLYVNDILRLDEPPLVGHSVTRKHTFALVTAVRSYYFAFPNAQDMQSWIDAINGVLHEAMPDIVPHLSLPRPEPAASEGDAVPDHEIAFDELVFDAEIGKGAFGVRLFFPFSFEAFLFCYCAY